MSTPRCPSAHELPVGTARGGPQGEPPGLGLEAVGRCRPCRRLAGVLESPRAWRWGYGVARDTRVVRGRSVDSPCRVRRGHARRHPSSGYRAPSPSTAGNRIGRFGRLGGEARATHRSGGRLVAIDRRSIGTSGPPRDRSHRDRGPALRRRPGHARARRQGGRCAAERWTGLVGLGFAHPSLHDPKPRPGP